MFDLFSGDCLTPDPSAALAPQKGPPPLLAPGGLFLRPYSVGGLFGQQVRVLLVTIKCLCLEYFPLGDRKRWAEKKKKGGCEGEMGILIVQRNGHRFVRSTHQVEGKMGEIQVLFYKP